MENDRLVHSQRHQVHEGERPKRQGGKFPPPLRSEDPSCRDTGENAQPEQAELRDKR